MATLQHTRPMNLFQKIDTAAGALTANAGSLLLQFSFLDKINGLLESLTLTVNLGVGLISALILFRSKTKKAKKLQSEINEIDKDENIQDDSEAGTQGR